MVGESREGEIERGDAQGLKDQGNRASRGKRSRVDAIEGKRIMRERE